MELLRLCLLLTVTLSVLVHSILSVPVMGEDGGNLARAVDSSLTALRDGQEAGKVSLLLSRLRRNSAQWMVGRMHYGHHHRGSSRRRWNHRSHHRHVSGGGRLANA